MWNILFAIFPTIFNVQIRMFVQMCKWLHWYEHTNSRCRVTSHTRIQIHICAHTHTYNYNGTCVHVLCYPLSRSCNFVTHFGCSFKTFWSYVAQCPDVKIGPIYPFVPFTCPQPPPLQTVYIRTYHYLHLSICECKRASNYDCRTHVCMYACISVNHMFERLPYDVPLPLNGDRRTVTHWDESHCFIFLNCGSRDKKVK